MANRRSLKKQVNSIAGQLFCECLVYNLYVPGTDKEEADQLMGRILNLQNDFISRISHTESGNAKGFYKKFREDFNKQVEEVIDAMGKLDA